MAKIRVAIVDDSSFVRAALARIVEGDARFEVVGQASDGRAAIELLARVRPDVATMDYNMPGMNGAEVVRRVLEQAPIPIVMVSAHTTEGAQATVDALAAGAIDVVAKPGGEVSMDLAKIADELRNKLAAAARARPLAPALLAAAARAVVVEPAPGPVRKPTPFPGAIPSAHAYPLVAPVAERVAIIGCSTGGPAALDAVMRALPARPAYGVVLVQHMSAALTTALAARLDGLGAFRVRQAAEGDRVRVGVALLAPGDRHLSIASGTVRLNDEAPVHGVRPAVDVTMRAVASSYGAKAVGVLLTGMGRDGALGLAAIRAAGGRTIAQDQASSVVFGMPKAAIELGVVDEIVPLSGIAAAVGRAMARIS
ncbi:MAG: chemotaxis-specific protein-glutamate methyltransferase CheB [Deltaproteobacteria bacterium]|nr:chemotaxis-specific protein-glutamate methyltransferase CheB [Deltaproteobacteria bacterium]